MKAKNMTSASGNKVANQFIITEEYQDSDITKKVVFQSYDSVIVEKVYYNSGHCDIYLDENYWDYSATTGKYRNQFLGENIAETRKKIKCGEYKLANLND